MNIESLRVRLGELDEKRKALEASLTETRDKAQAETRDLSDEESKSVESGFTELEKLDSDYAKLAAEIETEEKRDARLRPSNTAANTVAEVRVATPKGGKHEFTYARRGNHSFIADLIADATGSDVNAKERLYKHQREMADQPEYRDISTTATAGGGFVPPLYMGELWADIPRPGRPFADILPKIDLPAHGMSITLPRITTGAAVAVTTSENSSVNEVDLVEATVTTPVVTVAGQQDVSQQLFDRSDPSIDAVIFHDLRTSYDMKIDLGTLAGTGSSGQSLGIRAVTGVNTETYTDASPTGAELLPKIYEASSKVFGARYMPADTIVMSPRRAAWMASQLSSTFPLFQQGQLVQAAGTQDNSFLTSFAGLRVIIDANIGLTYGAGTNEDEIYVLRTQDLYFAEGPLQTRVLTDVGSGTLTVRLQLFAYSAFISARYPSAITVISGTGLVAPSF
jgi:HK97 family phage major capsid protein